MTNKYIIQNGLMSSVCVSILVNNYHKINTVLNIPIIKNSMLLTSYNIGTHNVGMWKIKKLK